jgi:hypothetical protein
MIKIASKNYHRTDTCLSMEKRSVKKYAPSYHLLIKTKMDRRFFGKF